MPIETIGENSTDDWSGMEDVVLIEQFPTFNQSTGNFLGMQKPGVGTHRNIVVRAAGLTNISSSATINDCELNLMLDFTSNPDTEAFRRILARPWVLDETTWNIYNTGNNWSTAGCLSNGNDRISTISATRTVSGSTGVYLPWSGSVMTQDVQDFVDGSETNNGWVGSREGTGNDGEANEFRSSRLDDGDRPYLEVDYTVDTGSIMTLVDGYVWGDTLSSQADALLIHEDGYVFGDSQLIQADAIANHTDGMVFGDTVSLETIAAFFMTMTDGYTYSDSSSILSAALMALVDGYTLSDALNQQAAAIASMADGMNFSDNQEALAALLATFVDGYILSDNVSLAQGNIMTMVDGLVWSDSTENIVSAVMSLTDGMTFSDALLAIGTFAMNCEDGYILRDSMSIIGGGISGKMVVRVQVKTGAIEFTVKTPKIDSDIN